MHVIKLDLQFSISIAEDKKLSVGNIACAVKESKIEAKIAEEIIHAIDAELVEDYCGTKYAQGNGECEYQRAGTSKRHIVTCVGELDITLHKITNTMTGNTFKPIEDVISFDGKKKYQEDISMIGVELSTKMTYRDAQKEGKLFIDGFPSAGTLNARVIDYGDKINDYTKDDITDANIDVAFSDGTKTHTQESDVKKNDIHVVLGIKNGCKVLMGVTVNKPWNESAQNLDDKQALSKNAVIVSDAEREMVDALVTGNREHQIDLIHLFRTTGYKLWEDEKMTYEERKKIIQRMEAILYHLKNSVKKHRADDDTEAIKARINATVDELKKIANELLTVGCYKAAEFIRYASNYAVTFARLALEGRIIPWNSNIIERLMAEISKRCKHKWMRWTTRGLEAMLRILLTRYTDEKTYERFKRGIMKLDNLKFISCEVKVIHVGGQVLANV